MQVLSVRDIRQILRSCNGQGILTSQLEEDRAIFWRYLKETEEGGAYVMVQIANAGAKWRDEGLESTPASSRFCNKARTVLWTRRRMRAEDDFNEA